MDYVPFKTSNGGEFKFNLNFTNAEMISQGDEPDYAIISFWGAIELRTTSG